MERNIPIGSSPFEFGIPVWRNVPRRPWFIYVHDTGDLLRMAPANGEHRAYRFDTCQEAETFLALYVTRSTTRGRRAVR